MDLSKRFLLHMQYLSRDVLKSISTGNSWATCDCQQAVISIQNVSVLTLAFRGYYPLHLCRFQPTETCFDFELFLIPAGLVCTSFCMHTNLLHLKMLGFYCLNIAQRPKSCSYKSCSSISVNSTCGFTGALTLWTLHSRLMPRHTVF